MSAKAVRIYEAKGLLDPADRTEAGYRMFTEHDVALVRFIRRASALGLSLAEIKEIIDLQREGAQPCARVLDLLDRRIRQIDRSLADLRALRVAGPSPRSRTRCQAEG
ncbi:MAG TPA: MerR family DNA-binding protein [Candidatus Dormibacteraeota bacterium]|nr:MerR family DNA-binding protein [Candidatus Dormibacteraeota bacterium]